MFKRFFAHLAIIGANIIYAINYTVAKEIIPEWMHPFALVICRVAGASILFWLMGLFARTDKIERKDFFILLLN